MPEIFLSPSSDRSWLIVAGTVVAVAVAANVTAYLSGASWALYAQAILWMIPAVVSWKRASSPYELRLDAKKLFGIALGVAATQIVVLLLFGSLYGFEDNPFGSPLRFMGEAAAALALVIGTEFARYHLVQALLPDGEDRALLIPWALMWVANLSIGQVLAAAGGRERLFFFIGVAALPASGASWFSSFLTMRGGPLPPLLYRGTLTLFFLLSPKIPLAPWMYLAVAGYVLPVLATNLIALKPELEGLLKPDAASERRVRIGWVAPVLATVATAWVLLATGVLGIKGIGVNGHSMEPTYRTGDMVITREVDVTTLEKGDVIVFQQPEREVVHRIIRIKERKGRLSFVTRGDNNDFRDPLVHQDDVQGKVVLHVPYLGWPQVISESFFARFF